MGFRINTNVAALSAHANSLSNNRALDSSLGRLNSGFRINSAADDASGMAIADSLRSQASSLGKAIMNANDAIGIVQTADKAMDEQIKILDTIKNKAIQSAQDGQTTETRRALQADISRLMEELDNIGNTTSFNGQKLLSGTFSNKEFQIGAYSNETVKASIGATTSDKIGLTRFETGHNVRLDDIAFAVKGATKDGSTYSDGKISVTFKNVDGINDVKIEPVQIANVPSKDFNSYPRADIGIKAGQGLGALAEAINKVSDKTGIKASVTVQSVFELPIKAGTTSESFTVNGVTIGSVEIQDKDGNGALRAAINSVKDQTGVEASVDTKGRLVLSNRDGRGIQITEFNAQIRNEVTAGTAGTAHVAVDNGGNNNAYALPTGAPNNNNGKLLKEAGSRTQTLAVLSQNKTFGNVSVTVGGNAVTDQKSASIGADIWSATANTGILDTDRGNTLEQLRAVNEGANKVYEAVGYEKGLALVQNLMNGGAFGSAYNFAAIENSAAAASGNNANTPAGIGAVVADDLLTVAAGAGGANQASGSIDFTTVDNFDSALSLVDNKLKAIDAVRKNLKATDTTKYDATANNQNGIKAHLALDSYEAELTGLKNALKDMQRKVGEGLKTSIGLDDTNGTNFGRLSLVSSNGKDIVVEATDTAGNNMSKALGFDRGVAEKTVSLRETNASIDKETADAMGFNAEDWQATNRGDNQNGYPAGVMTLKGAMAMMNIAEAAQKALEAIRSDLGSVQNQLVSTVNNISVTQVNVKSAESNIRDVDFAEESATFSKHQILAQSGVYAMSQANAVQQNVMRLLQ